MILMLDSITLPCIIACDKSLHLVQLSSVLLFSLYMLQIAPTLWVWLFPQRHSLFFCGVFSLLLTTLSLLPVGLPMIGCTPRQQCYPMDFMSLLSSKQAWTLHGCFCLTESKCVSSGRPPTYVPLFLKSLFIFLALLHNCLNICFSMCVQVVVANADNLSAPDTHQLHYPLFLLSWTEDLWSLVEQISQNRPLAFQIIGKTISRS